MWARYHLTEAQDFYNNNDAWEVSADPGTEGAQGQTQTTDPDTGEVTSTRAARIDPYYLQIELPGTDELDFALTRPFAPFSDSGGRPQLTALMTASSDPGTYGQLRVLEMPPGNLPDGPTAIEGTITNDEAASSLETLLGGGGSKVLQGNLIAIPVDNSLVWVRPFYVESDQTQIPELERVIAVFENQVAVENTLEEALAALFGEAPDLDEVVDQPTDPDDPDAPELPEETENEKLTRLLNEAAALFVEADTALAEGDLGTYQSKTEQARAKIDEAAAILGAEPAAEPATTDPDPESTTTTTEPDSA
jgi:uncharacterized membrane protein (UPF0182 family)